MWWTRYGLVFLKQTRHSIHMPKYAVPKAPAIGPHCGELVPAWRRLLQMPGTAQIFLSKSFGSSTRCKWHHLVGLLTIPIILVISCSSFRKIGINLNVTFYSLYHPLPKLFPSLQTFAAALWTSSNLPPCQAQAPPSWASAGWPKRPPSAAPWWRRRRRPSWGGPP